MKTTPNYRIPYPECNPPLVKDLADSPRNLLAIASDADSLLEQLAFDVGFDTEVVPEADIRSTGTQTLASDQNFSLPDIFSGVDTDLSAPSRIGIRYAGMYLITATCEATTGAFTLHRMTLDVNGLPVRSSVIRPGAGGIRNNVIQPQGLNVGDIVTVRQRGSTPVTYSSARLCLVRMLPF